MKLTNTIKGTLIIMRMALQRNTTYDEARKDLQEVLDEAWSEAWTPGNLAAQVKWQQLFPGGKKPSVEEFIACLASGVKP